MTIDDILAGESKNIEFKERLPEKSIKYMKSVVAFSNGGGGKIVFGVVDDTKEFVGFPKEDVFRVMDAIANAISDSCEPAIIPDITLQDFGGKTASSSKFLKADSVLTTSNPLARKMAYLSVFLALHALLMKP